jgi:hypothetical protein
MRPKTSGGHDTRNVIERLYERGGEAFNQMLSDLLSRKGVADQLGKTVGRAVDAKRRVDRNMQFLLSLLNLPSRADYHRLLTKIEALQGSLVNLNIKLDRLLAAQHERPAPKRRAPKPRPAAHPHGHPHEAKD